jgi:hypothetical protein
LLEREYEANSAWRCPYCISIDPDDQSTFKTRGEVYNHIDQSVQEFGEEHERLKKQDGWYEPGWSVSQRERVTKPRRSADEGKGRDMMERLGVKYSDEAELQRPIPHPADARLVFGGSSDLSIPKALENFISYGTSNLEADIAQNYQGLIEFGADKPWSTIPPELQGLAEFDEEFDTGV